MSKFKTVCADTIYDSICVMLIFIAVMTIVIYEILDEINKKLHGR